MRYIKNIFTLIYACSFINVFSDINSSSSLLYRIEDLAQGIGPNTNSKITILQASGIKFFFCDLSLVTSVTSTNIAMSMTIQNRFGSRFSASELGQIYLSIYFQIIKTAILSSWETYVTSQSANISSKLITTTTSGISALIVCPSSEATTAMDCLSKFYTMISSLSITDNMIDAGYSTAYSGCILQSFKPPSNSSVSTNGADNVWHITLHPKLDASQKYGDAFEDESYSACGSMPINCSSIINTERSSYNSKKNIQHLHELILKERSFLIFAASKDSTIKGSMASLASSFSKKTNPKNVQELNKPSCGVSFKRGTEVAYDLASNTSSGFGGILSFGKISVNSALTTFFILKTVSNATYSSCFYNYGPGISAGIYAGEIHFRISCGSGGMPLTLSTVWSSFTGIVATRYSTSTYDGDFSGSNSIIPEIIKHFSPGSANGKASFLTYGFNALYQDTPTAYVLWMEMFYGAFKILKDLTDLNAKSGSEKDDAIKTACKTILSSSTSSVSTGFYCRME